MMPGYYCVRGTKRYGPFSAQQLRELGVKGQIRPNDVIESDDAKSRSKACDIPNLLPTPTRQENIRVPNNAMEVPPPARRSKNTSDRRVSKGTGDKEIAGGMVSSGTIALSLASLGALLRGLLRIVFDSRGRLDEMPTDLQLFLGVATTVFLCVAGGWGFYALTRGDYVVPTLGAIALPAVFAIQLSLPLGGGLPSIAWSAIWITLSLGGFVIVVVFTLGNPSHRGKQ